MQDLPRIFTCLAKLEREVYDVYHKISLRTVDKHVSWIMEFIALDSWKHYLLYMEMSGRLTNEETIREEDVDCEALLGQLFMDTLNEQVKIKQELEAKTEISNTEILNLLENLVGVEETAGEEVFVETVTTLLSKSPMVKNEKGIIKALKLIAEDEKRHIKLLDHIKGIINKESS